MNQQWHISTNNDIFRPLFILNIQLANSKMCFKYTRKSFQTKVSETSFFLEVNFLFRRIKFPQLEKYSEL